MAGDNGAHGYTEAAQYQTDSKYKPDHSGDVKIKSKKTGSRLRLFEALDLLNVRDAELGAKAAEARVLTCGHYVGQAKATGGTVLSMGVPDDAAKDVASGKLKAMLVLVDLQAYNAVQSESSEAKISKIREEFSILTFSKRKSYLEDVAKIADKIKHLELTDPADLLRLSLFIEAAEDRDRVMGIKAVGTADCLTVKIFPEDIDKLEKIYKF